ncbi:hypothetical protein B0H66DRAFT_380727 [Apodospora peruviana]|uniref:Uncharacterized protein n=1 Tax=Apodospora peruviana TaxID=516989 RepID=A0AAE0HTU7_9PEZI|nr:hypothetical protein B0H66DRAFT_380727 [Apodospora peruviana]
MLAIDNLFGQLRTIIHMSPSPDSSSSGSSPKSNSGFSSSSTLQHEMPPTPPTSTTSTDTAKQSTTQIQTQTQNSHWSQMMKRQKPRPAQPEPGSLYGIMRENAGISLYVLPICWTDVHTQLIGAQFQERPTIFKPVPEYVPGRWLEPSRIAKNLTTELHTLVRDQPAAARAFCKNRAIKHVMATLFPGTLSRPKTGVELDMYFGTRIYRKAVRIPCLWKSPPSSLDITSSFDSVSTIPVTSFSRITPTPPESPSTSTEYAPNKPVLAYISRSQLSMIRQNLFRVVPGPNNSHNKPVAELQRLRSKMLMPKDISHDSYLVAIIIAMAQAHFYNDASYKSSSQESTSTPGGSSRRRKEKMFRMPPPVFDDVKVQIITHDEGNDSTPNFIVYTATVTAAFLERWMYPHKAPLSKEEMDKGAAGLKIDYTPVSFWPILGLRERLAKALRREVAGDPVFSDPEHIGFWDVLVEPESRPVVFSAAGISAPRTPVTASRKRRHGHGHGYVVGERPALSEVLNSSFEEAPMTSSEDLDRPVLSPDAKRRRTASSRSSSTAVNPLEVC